jgi:hypothetical protein
MTKFVKTLIIINGLIVPIVLVVFLSILIKEFIRNSPQPYVPDAINTVNTITKDGDTLLTQGLRYDDPESVYNSKNFIIKVMPRTYDKPKKVISNSSDYKSNNILMMNESRAISGYYVNILFLDSNYNVIARLVDKRASIESITIPTGYSRETVDTTVKNIGYLIAFEDSNNDKRIDWNDNYDLYISGLDGKNLYKVTNQVDVKGFNFINHHNDIFISFTDRSDIRDEYKITRFAIFNIKTRQLQELTSVDKALFGIQKILK